MPGQLWEVVGGVDKGGILVREGQSTSSKQLDDRLSTGALVDEVELKGERLRYRRLNGTGPSEGWVSITITGKELLQRKSDEGFSAAEALELRCARELAKPAVTWTPVGMDALEKVNEVSKGMFYGMEFPWNAETLEKMGPVWCTKAFHAAGTLPGNNRVTKVKDVRQHIGGGACAKIIFDVEYEAPAEGLHTKLFAKIPWPLEGKTRSDRVASSIMQQGMEIGEINACRLLESRLPFRIPKFYFGDVSNETTNFILITERIPFGQMEGDNKMDPAYEKSRDWELQGTYEEYYYLLIRVGAKMAGMYWADKLAPKDTLDKFFSNSALRGLDQWGMGPHNTGMAEKEFLAKIRMAAEFVEVTAKAIFPASVTTPEFIKTYKRVMSTINVYSAEMNWWCNRKPEYIAWSHGNLNVDNVFFWRDADHKLDVGVLDWGGARTESMGWKLWWWLYGCEFDYLHEHIDGMLGCFIKVYQENGGPALELEELKWQFTLSALAQGVGLLGAVPQIYAMCPKKEWPTIVDRKDPRIAENINGKNTLRIYVQTFISVCRIIAEWDVPAKLDKWVEELCQMARMPPKQIIEA